MARLIIVEDGRQVLVLAEAILADAGHETWTAADAAEALALLRSDATYDALVTDIDLGKDKPNGLSLAAEAVQMRKGLKVVYTSGQGPTDGMRELFVSNAVFVPKPYLPDDLLAAVAKVLGDRA